MMSKAVPDYQLQVPEQMNGMIERFLQFAS